MKGGTKNQRTTKCAAPLSPVLPRSAPCERSISVLTLLPPSQSAFLCPGLPMSVCSARVSLFSLFLSPPVIASFICAC